MRNKARVVLALALVVSLATLAIACQQAAPAPTPTTAPKPAAQPAAAPTAASQSVIVPTAAPKPTAPAAAPTIAPSAFVPNKPVEFVIFASPGGGSSIFAETLKNIIEKYKFIPVPIATVNKPGGSQAVGMAYLASKKGSDYHWGSCSPSYITAGLTGASKTVSYKDFTDISMLALDENVIFVKYDSPYKTIKDLVEAGKPKPKGVKVGGTNVGGLDSIFVHMFGKAAGVDFNYVAFQGGGEVNAAVLGGHVDFASANPSEVMPQVEGKTMRILAVGSDKRLAGLPDVPTLKESGYDCVVQAMRGINAPPEMTEPARAYYEAAFKKVMDTPEFKKYTEENMMTPNYLSGAETRKFYDKFADMAEKALVELGVVKK